MAGCLTAGPLLAQARWIRRLARALVEREDVAADLVQETWLVALRSPPGSDRPLGPWLAGVLRNLIYKRRRSEARRSQRERAAARAACPIPTPEVLVDRAQTQRLLVTLVMELAEPYRSTLLLRYYEGLSGADIARRQGIPAGTVRSRLKQGLDRLRERLDARCQGDRSRWCLALAPLASAPGPSASGPGALGHAARFLILASAVTLALGLLAWPPGSGRRSLPATAAGHHRAVATAAAARSRLAPPQPWLGQAGIPTRRIAGRVTDQGAPVAGADVVLVNELTTSGLAPELHARTDAHGRFDLGRQAPTRHLIVASAPNRTAAMWTADLRDPTPAQPPDRLELALDPCVAPLFGAVRDASGGGIAHAHVRRLSEDFLPGADAETDDAGRYSLCLPPGQSMVQVDGAGYGAIEGLVRTYAPLRRDFALVPEAIVAGQTIRAQDGAPVAGALVALVPTGSATSTSAAVATTSDGSGHFRLLGVAAGHHELIAYADGLRTVATLEVTAAPGQLTNATCRLQATSRLRGRVVANDVPVAGVTVRVSARSSFTQADAISQLDGSFLLDHVPRGEVELEVEPVELISPKAWLVDRPSLGALRIEVAVRGSVRGRVLRAGRAQPFAQVELRAASASIEGESGPDGSFELRGVPPGRHLVSASSRLHDARGQTALTLERGQHVQGVDIELDRAAAVAGLVVDARGAPLPGLYVRLERVGAGEEPALATTAPDGTFVASGLAGGGEYRAEVTSSAASPSPLRPARPFPRLRIADGATRIEGIRLSLHYERLAISGTVVDAAGAPQPDVRVVASRALPGEEPRFSDWDELPAATTSLDGGFTLSDLAAGAYRLRARSTSGAEATLPAVPAGRRDLVLALEPTAGLDGALSGFAEPPDVWVTRVGQIPSTPVHVTARANRFQVFGLAPGSYRVSATSISGGDVEAVELAAGTIATVTLSNRGTARVTGRVVDLRTRAPLAGLLCVRGPSLGDRLAWQPLPDFSETDREGRFDLGPGPAGELIVECCPGGGRYVAGRAWLTVGPGRTAEVEIPVVARREGVLLDRPGLVPTIGVGFDLATARARVAAVLPDGPAQRAGLRPGDVVVAVDGVAVAELTPEGVAALIVDRAPDAIVSLTALRGNDSISLEIPPVEGPAHP